MSDLCGVYAIVNLVSGKRYFGSTIRPISERLREHLIDLRLGCHYNRHLSNAWNKYGEDAFILDAVEEYPLGTTIETVEAREKIYIDLFWDLGTIYNINKLPGCPAAPWTEERRLAHSERIKASWATEERRQREIASWTDERRQNLSEAIAKSWEDADQRRQEMSQRRKDFWTDERRKAQTELNHERWTEDRRQWMSELQKALWTDEKDRKLKDAYRTWRENGGGRDMVKFNQEYWTEERRREHAELARSLWTDERRKKAIESYTDEKRKMHSEISKKLGLRPPSNLGKKHSEATKAKMSATAKLRNAKKRDEQNATQS